MDFSKNPLLDPKVQDGEDPPSWKLWSPYLDEKSSDFNENWYTNADLELDDSQTQYENF